MKYDDTYSAQAAQSQRGYWKNLSRKWGIILLGTMVLLAIFVLNPPPGSKLVKENGRYYLYIDTKYVNKNNTDKDGNIIEFPHYTMDFLSIDYPSLDEMERAIRKSSFSPRELHRLGIIASPDGVIPLFDLDHLKDAVFPDGLSYLVKFTGHDYFLIGESEDRRIHAQVHEITAEEFQNRITYDNTFVESIEIRVWASSNTDPRQNIPYIEKKWSDMLYRCYILETETTCYYVEESFRDDSGTLSIYSISIYGQEHNGICFELSIQCDGHYPELDWLAAFHMVDKE